MVGGARNGLRLREFEEARRDSGLDAGLAGCEVGVKKEGGESEAGVRLVR